MRLPLTLTPTPTLTPTLTLAPSAYTGEIHGQPWERLHNLPYIISPIKSSYLNYISLISPQANFAVNREGDYVKGHKGSPFLDSPNPN